MQEQVEKSVVARFFLIRSEKQIEPYTCPVAPFMNEVALSAARTMPSFTRTVATIVKLGCPTRFAGKVTGANVQRQFTTSHSNQMATDRNLCEG